MRTSFAVAVAGLVVVGVAGSWMVTASDEEPSPEREVSTGPPLVLGVGGVTVEIAAPLDGDGVCADRSTADDVVPLSTDEDCDRSDDELISSLTFSTAVGPGVRAGLRPDGDVDGHRVVVGATRCPADQPPAECAVVGVPNLGAFFTIRATDGDGAELVEQVRGSLRVIDEGMVAVPGLRADGPVGSHEAARALLEEAGFTAEVETSEYECPPTASCVGSYVAGFDPSAGAVVPAGSTVTIEYEVMVP